MKKVDLSALEAPTTKRLVLKKGKRAVIPSFAPFDAKAAKNKKDHWRNPVSPGHQEVLIPYIDKHGNQRAALQRVRKSNLTTVSLA